VFAVGPAGSIVPFVNPRDVRSSASRASDPLAMIVGGMILVLASVRLFSTLGLSPDEVAALHAGLIMVGGGLRLVLESKNAAKVAIVAEQEQAGAYRRGLVTDPPRVVRRGLGEGGRLVKGDEGDEEPDDFDDFEPEEFDRACDFGIPTEDNEGCSPSGQVRQAIGPDDETPRYARHEPEPSNRVQRRG
jgi:hypothetical protein